MKNCLMLALAWPVCGIEILGVGAPRTGTQSLQAALEMLGYKTGHTGNSNWLRLPLLRYMFLGGPLGPVTNLFEEFDALMDEPAHLLYPEALRQNPDCKFILTVRDPAAWYGSWHSYFQHKKNVQTEVPSLGLKLEQDSHRRTLRGQVRLHGASASPSSHGPERAGLKGLPGLDGGGMVRALYFGCHFLKPVQDDPDVERCLAGYNQHIENVKAVVPKDQLLIFNISDGWEPLCKFLGKAVPRAPFPHVDHFPDP